MKLEDFAKCAEGEYLEALIAWYDVVSADCDMLSLEEVPVSMNFSLVDGESRYTRLRMCCGKLSENISFKFDLGSGRESSSLE